MRLNKRLQCFSLLYKLFCSRILCQLFNQDFTDHCVYSCFFVVYERFKLKLIKFGSPDSVIEKSCGQPDTAMSVYLYGTVGDVTRILHATRINYQKKKTLSAISFSRCSPII